MTVDASREILFEELVQTQGRFVFRVAYAVLRNRDDAEDCGAGNFSEALSEWRVGNDAK